MCVRIVCRNILETSYGQSPDNMNQETGGFSAIAASCGGVPANGCGAELDSDDDASTNRHRNGFQEATETDRLAACRMTLLEDVMVPSNDNSAICPRFSIERPSTAPMSPLVVEVEDPTSTNFPDATPPGVTTAKTDKISSNNDGFSVAIGGLSPPDTGSRSNDPSGSRSFGTERKHFGARETLIYGEANGSSAAASILGSVPSSCSDAQTQRLSSTTKYSVYDDDRRPDGTVGKVNDSSWRQTVSWSTIFLYHS